MNRATAIHRWSVPVTDRKQKSVPILARTGKQQPLINAEAVDLFVFRSKSVSIHFELMFTRPLFQTADIEAQHRLLNEVAELVDSGRVRSTMRENYGRIDAANLMRAMRFLKTGSAIGKVVLAGF